jgi:hypothetical protein
LNNKILAVLTFALSCQSFADSQKFHSWEFVNNDNLTSARTHDQTGVLFGIGCTKDQNCMLYLETNECNIGKPYAVMVSASHGHTVVTSECVESELSESNYVLEIINAEKMFNFMYQAADFVAAIPHNDGSISLSNFGLRGSAEAMKAFGDHQKQKEQSN